MAMARDMITLALNELSPQVKRQITDESSLELNKTHLIRAHKLASDRSQSGSGNGAPHRI